MKAIKSTVDIDKYRERMENILFRQDSKTLVFLDTNFLTWIYKINKPSFEELKRLLYRLVQDQKLIIPNWAVHEYNNLISRKADEIISPFKKRLGLVGKEFEFLKETGRMILDDDFIIKRGYKSKKDFLTQLENDVKALNSKIGFLKDISGMKDESRGEFIEEIIDIATGDANMEEILNSMNSAPLRFDLRLPPGYEDGDKPENKYGDMIIWKEVLANCKGKSIMDVLFLSRDVKRDWVYVPPKIRVDGKTTPNNRGFIYHSPQPWLEHELKEVSSNTDFLTADMQTLIEVLYSPKHNFNNFIEFKHLAKTIDLELKNNETNKVIEWIVSREDQRAHLTKTVCYWASSPGEADIDELRKWGETNIDISIDFSKVEWQEVFIQLFI